MARLKERERALILRKQGKSYSQIKKILKISKSTLSYWLTDFPLSKQRIRELRDWNEQRIEKYRNTMRLKREKRLSQYYKEQKNFIANLNQRELFIAGLFLYWGEGTKGQNAILSISNTDPSVIKFFIKWLTDFFKISREKLKVQLQLYNDMNLKREIVFWSKILSLSRRQFTKPYIKSTSLERINHKGGFGHGTCSVRLGDARLAEKIKMAIKVVSDWQ